MEDEDIKIFTTERSAEDRADVNSEVLNTVELMDRERQNGNSTKARVIGKHLAKLFMEEISPDYPRDEMFRSGAVVQQIGVLFLFTAETAVNIYFPSSTLSTIAIATLHNQLEDFKYKVYRDVYESSAYSFYYLSIRKGSDNVSRSIGEAFAMLCQKEGNVDFRREGCTIYKTVMNEVEELVKKANFAV